MCISDWSSDGCSSDLIHRLHRRLAEGTHLQSRHHLRTGPGIRLAAGDCPVSPVRHQDRKSVVSGKSVSVRVYLGGRRILKKKNTTQTSILSRITTNISRM